MIEKRVYGRAIQKHDIEVNWLKAINFIPMQGEIIVYDIDENYDYERFKIGDGVTVVSSLPFSNIRTHYDGAVTKTVAWDGNTDGLTSVNGAYLVSDVIVPVDSIVGSTIILFDGDTTIITQEAYDTLVAQGMATEDITSLDGVFIVRAAGAGVSGLTFNQTGVYFTTATQSFKYRENVLQTLDEKYIPNTIARVSELNESMSTVVKTTEQTLTEDEQVQARVNIGLDFATDEEIIALMLEEGIIDAIETESGALLASDENNILTM